MASMYPFGGPRFRDGPRKVQASERHQRTAEPTSDRKGLPVPSMRQFLQASFGLARSHLHLDLRHWSQANGRSAAVRECMKI